MFVFVRNYGSTRINGEIWLQIDFGGGLKIQKWSLLLGSTDTYEMRTIVCCPFMHNCIFLRSHVVIVIRQINKLFCLFQIQRQTKNWRFFTIFEHVYFAKTESIKGFDIMAIKKITTQTLKIPCSTSHSYAKISTRSFCI